MSDAQIAPKRGNKQDTRESWLRAATNALRHHFIKCGYEIPHKMRFSIGFTSKGRKGASLGELWHPATSADGSCELFIRADLEDPAEVLAVLVHQLVHSVLPPDAGHGRLFGEAMQRIGLEGQRRDAKPAPLLAAALKDIADGLGPLPHAALSIDLGPDGKGKPAARPADRPAPQRNRMLKAVCTSPGCEYLVRIAPKWIAEIGVPRCPKHHLPLAVEGSPATSLLETPRTPSTVKFGATAGLPAASPPVAPPPSPAPAPSPSPSDRPAFTAADEKETV